MARRCLSCVGVVCSLLLSACGGGGGSSSGGEGGSDAYGVRVLHAAIDGSPVDVRSSLRAEPVLLQAVFAGTKGYRSIPRGEQTLALTRPFSSSDVIASFNTSVGSGDRYSILLYGDNLTFGLRARLIADDVPASITGSAVRVVNGVTGASALVVAVGSGQVTQVGFGENSGYIQTASGSVHISASRSADGSAVVSTNRTLEEGRAYTILIAGQIGYYVRSNMFVDK